MESPFLISPAGIVTIIPVIGGSRVTTGKGRNPAIGKNFSEGIFVESARNQASREHEKHDF
jgi:hypothetical protein